MASTAQRRRCSKDVEVFFSEAMNNLSQHAASFIKLYNNNEPRMRQIAEELQEITAKVQKKQTKVKKVKKAGIVTAGVVAGLGVISVPFTTGFSLVITGIAGATSIAVATAPKKWLLRKLVMKVQKLVNDLLQTVVSLKTELEEIKKLCEDLQREAAGSDTEHIIRLETHSEKLLDVVAHLKTSVTAGRVTDRADQCAEAVDGFKSMKTQLEDLRESTDTENIQTDSQ